MSQQILVMETRGCSPRSEMVDGTVYSAQAPLTERCPYACPMDAVADGWRLLAPPVALHGLSGNERMWWLVREDGSR